MNAKILWLSRHEMTADQKADLATILRCAASEVEVVTRNVTWQATSDAANDRIMNRATWQTLINETHYENGARCICGVFPPVAMEALGRGMKRPEWLRLLTPVSRQAPELRIGDGAIPFVHVRWCGL